MQRNEHADGVITVQLAPSDIELAIKCVKKVFDDAIESGKHKAGDWRLQGFEGNWNHLEDHFNVLDDENTYEIMIHPERVGDDHLANLCCRALLLLQLREETR